MSLDVCLEKDTLDTDDSLLYSANITHNLNVMASVAGLYECIWRPDENCMFYAKDLIIPLTEGYKELLSNPDKYKQYNPSNGGGSYTDLCIFTQRYLFACLKYPTATIRVWR